MWRRGRAYAQDLRDRVFACADSGMSVTAIAKTLFVSISYVSKVLSRRGRTGELSARPQRCHLSRKLTAYLEPLGRHIASHPDATLQDIQHWLLDSHQVSACLSLISKTLADLDLTFKKRPCTPPSRIVRTWPKPGPPGERSSPGWTPPD